MSNFISLTATSSYCIGISQNFPPLIIITKII
jgi:hypothetical protein